MTTLPHPKPPITEAIQKGLVWHRLGNGSYHLTPLENVRRQEPWWMDLTYTDDDLASVDPAWVPAFHFLFRYCGSDGLQVARLLRATEQHWRQPGPVYLTQKNLVNGDNDALRLLSVQSIELLAEQARDALVDVLGYVIADVDSLPIATYYLDHSCNLPLSWLDSHYPGFTERARIGKSLNMNRWELAAYACQPTTEQTLDLPDTLLTTS